LATQTADEALRLSLDHPAEVFIAKDGPCAGKTRCCRRSVQKAASGLLQRKQQIEKLAKDIEKFRAEYDAIINEKKFASLTATRRNSPLLKSTKSSITGAASSRSRKPRSSIMTMNQKCVR